MGDPVVYGRGGETAHNTIRIMGQEGGAGFLPTIGAIERGTFTRRWDSGEGARRRKEGGGVRRTMRDGVITPL